MNDAADATRPPNARLVIDLTALRRGIVGGLVVIVPVSLVVALVSHDRRRGYGGWLLVAFAAILYGYATAGYGAAHASRCSARARDARRARRSSCGSWCDWRFRSRGDRLGFGIVAVATNALFAVALGAAGGLFAAGADRRHSPTTERNKVRTTHTAADSHRRR